MRSLPWTLPWFGGAVRRQCRFSPLVQFLHVLKFFITSASSFSPFGHVAPRTVPAPQPDFPKSDPLGLKISPSRSTLRVVAQTHSRRICIAGASTDAFLASKTSLSPFRRRFTSMFLASSFFDPHGELRQPFWRTGQYRTARMQSRPTRRYANRTIDLIHHDIRPGQPRHPQSFVAKVQQHHSWPLTQPIAAEAGYRNIMACQCNQALATSNPSQ